VKPYVIKQGDYLLKLAHILGFDANKVWNDGKNAELKKERKDPAMLRPGDILFVPDEPKPRLPLNLKETNVFVARVPSVKVAVVLKQDGKPLADKAYVVEGIGDETPQQTDGEGRVKLELPVHTREVTIRFSETGQRFNLRVGDLDPPETPSGARMRLTSLGFYKAKLAGGGERYVGHEDAALEAAVRAFQNAKGMEATGKLDDTTRAALVEAHGS
jgi:hypothetical protein